MSLPTHWADPHPHAPPPTTRWQRAAAAVAATMFADIEGPPPQERLDWTVDRLAGFLREADATARWLFRLSLFAILWLSPLLVFRLPTFLRLSHDKRTKALHRFERSPVGLSMLAVKAILCIIYFEHPRVLEECHFDGEAADKRRTS